MPRTIDGTADDGGDPGAGAGGFRDFRNPSYAAAPPGGADMAKGEQRGNRESKKPKKEKPKTIAAAPSQKGASGSSGGSPRK
jgi:hypothetical protein